MYRVRRNDLSPRMEMTPMIDVVFLLLTFFIYSFVMMIEANVLPGRLLPVASGGEVGTQGAVQAITVGRDGALFFNREAVTMAQLDAKLAELASRPDPPRIYLAMLEEGDVDRGPVLVALVQRLQAAGLSDFAFVGPKRPSAPTPP
ncbi:MAG: biopolymer transporter ExbD [Phycisphaeraceae bacterium]